jgi:thiol:disulfide interchange protein DsbD
MAVVDEELSAARAAGKPVAIEFFAEWCAACRVLERGAWTSSEVAREASRFVALRVDATNEDEVIVALSRRFRVEGLPTTAFVASSGELASTRVLGIVGADELVNAFRSVR